MRTRTLLPALAGVALVVALTGCTASSDEPTASGSTPAATGAATGPADNACVDDVAYVQFSDDVQEVSLPDGCGAVVVLGDGGTAELGPVGDLTVMGNGTTVDAESVTRLDVEGDDNTVTFGGVAPEDLSGGEGNTVSPR